jgi:F0F1-type ATP synthase assembly protein I
MTEQGVMIRGLLYAMLLLGLAIAWLETTGTPMGMVVAFAFGLCAGFIGRMAARRS